MFKYAPGLIVVSDYGLGDRGLIHGRGKVSFLWPLCPDQLSGTLNLLYNGYREGDFFSLGIKRGLA
jgi:hypothetical protein